MAVVYLAWDEPHSRDVAVKVLSPSVAGALGVDRFVDEIRTTAGLSHPHILALLDSGHVDESPFYVMPYVRGESLRDRLKREEVLSLDEALRIGSAVAGAVAHAHAEGVIHRDIKPANILLDRAGNPYLADFGIARALSASADTLRTSPGQILGTLQYMSPEQLTPEGEIDGTTDLYSLSCVVFEMLAGSPPFNASSPRALMAEHLLSAPPLLRSVRADIPRALDDLLQSGLAKNATDRIASAAEFARRLDDIRAASRVRQIAPEGDALVTELRPTRRKRLVYAGGAALSVGAVALGIATALPPSMRSDTALDTTRYAVLPFDHDESLGAMVRVESLFEDALSRWDGVSVVDGLQLEGLVSGAADPQRLSLDEARDVARAVGAGRILTGQARAYGDSVRVEAALRDPTSSAEPLERFVFTIATDALEGDAQVAKAAESLLFGVTPAGVGSTPTGTMSVPARREFDLGQRALAEWNLIDAGAHFAAAVEHDPYFDLALLWKAQVLSWQGSLTQAWAADARRVVRAAEDLPPRERNLATALAAIADGRYPDACTAYGELSDRNPDDFAAWFGLGKCQGDDPLVGPDSDSPTGWRFRGNAHAAAAAYRRAFESLPSSYRAFGAGGSDRVSNLLYARRGVLRGGRGPAPASRTFVGFPEWRGDTLAFLAVPADSVLSFDPDREAAAEALTHQRRALLDVANSWVRAFPGSGSARYTLAVARELVGHPGALTSYREARATADDGMIRALTGIAEVVLSVRLALPDDPEGIRAAVTLGDSILAENAAGSVQASDRMAELAVILGRPTLAARISRREEVSGGLANLPPEIVREGSALLAFAAAGGPADSIRAIETGIERMMLQAVPRAGLGAARQHVFELPSFLAFPAVRLAFLDSAGLPRGAEARAIAALDSPSGEAPLDILGEPIPDSPWDVVLARANVLVAVGRSREALDLLSTRLGTIAAADPAVVTGMGRLGGLVRASALRAELEQTIGSPTQAIRWARAVDALWSSGDASVVPLLSRMRAILDAPLRR